MTDTIVYRYVAEQNPQGGYLAGVPLRDLTAADLADIPAWLHPSIAAQPFYETVSGTKTPKAGGSGNG
jgi:hypothetical protein